MTMVTTVWGWAERNHGIRSQVSKLDKPATVKREFFLPRERWPELLSHCHQELHDVLNFMLLTGARPQEARILQKRHWQIKRFVRKPSESKGQKEGRVVLVPDEFIERIEQLLDRPFVFQTSNGQPWSKNSFNCASRRLKKKLGEPEFCAYTCRHSFAADKVRRGVEIALVAKRMGHKSTNMVYQRYGHLARQDERLLEACNT